MMGVVVMMVLVERIRQSGGFREGIRRRVVGQSKGSLVRGSFGCGCNGGSGGGGGVILRQRYENLRGGWWR